MTTNEAYISGDWTDSSVQLYVMTDSIDNSNYEYVWYRNDQIIKGASSSFYVVDSETEAAEYSVSIINSKGKVFDSENVVDVNIDKLMPTCKFTLNSVHEEKIYVLKQILQISSSGNQGADLKLLGESANTGTSKISKKISNRKQFVLVSLSPTGVYRKETDLTQI